MGMSEVPAVQTATHPLFGIGEKIAFIIWEVSSYSVWGTFF